MSKLTKEYEMQYLDASKPFSITVIQVYAPSTNAKEAEVERFYEDLQGLLKLTPKKDAFSLQGTGMQK